MKFLSSKNGQAGLLLACSLIFASCNKDEFAPMEQFVEGVDKYCSQAQDEKSCIDLGSICTTAFEESADETAEPKFAACVGSWYYEDPAEGGTSGGSDGSTTGGSTGGTDSGTDGSTTGGTDGSTTGGTSTGGTDGSTTGGSSSGGSTSGNGGNNGNSQSGGNGGSSDPEANAPIEDAYNTNCANLAPEQIWVMKEVKNKKVVNTVKKVKVCHQTANQAEHTILIACPALKAHIKHHDDYIGLCK